MVRHPKTSFAIWTVDLLLCLPSSFACERLKTSTDWFQNTLVSKSVHVGRKLNSPEIIKKTDAKRDLACITCRDRDLIQFSRYKEYFIT